MCRCPGLKHPLFIGVFFWGVELDCMTLDIIPYQTMRDKNQTFNPRAVETLESLAS